VTIVYSQTRSHDQAPKNSPFWSSYDECAARPAAMRANSKALEVKNQLSESLVEPIHIATAITTPRITPKAIENGKAVGLQAAPKPIIKIHVSKPSRITLENERQKKPVRFFFESPFFKLSSTNSSIFLSHFVDHDSLSLAPGAR